MVSLSTLTLTLLALSAFAGLVDGHGYLKTPRSRNWAAAEDGVWSGGSRANGVPRWETCPHCLNTKKRQDVCGATGGKSYDNWVDINGRAMPWKSQATYIEGAQITVEAYLDTNHAGHMDVLLCPNGDSSTQACFEANPVRSKFVCIYYMHSPPYPTRSVSHEHYFFLLFKTQSGQRSVVWRTNWLKVSWARILC